ncbi:hypothetical protein HY478_02320 [Candidatus Uhrbacteria bacterium]|nr:hypothetical protein [Candidatus Uhrbacteria bacterium]
MPAAKIVVLILSVWNSESGTLLYEDVQQMPEFSMTGSHIEDCRLEGIARAKKLVARYRVNHPYAFANVNCKWMPQSPYHDL